jgi:general secretion pathway protein G
MIELIFVIVIIGILAAVAIPKLSATRDDAKISSIVANTRTVVEDVKNFYTAQGEAAYLAAPVTTITDVPLFTDNTCATPATQATTFAGTPLFICDDVPGDVLDVTSTNTAGQAQTVTLTQGASSSTINTALNTERTFQALTNGTSGKTTTLGGQRVLR